jgi:hypothetical protein
VTSRRFVYCFRQGVVSSEVGSVEEGRSVAFVLYSHRIHIVRDGRELVATNNSGG